MFEINVSINQSMTASDILLVVSTPGNRELGISGNMDFTQQPLMEWQQHSDVALGMWDCNSYFVMFYCNHLLRENSWFAVVVTTLRDRLGWQMLRFMVYKLWFPFRLREPVYFISRIPPVVGAHAM